MAALMYVSRTNQSVVFVLWFERCSNFNEVMQDSERTVRKMDSLRNEKFWLFCAFNVYLKIEKCDSTGQVKDTRLPIVNMLLML